LVNVGHHSTQQVARIAISGKVQYVGDRLLEFLVKAAYSAKNPSL